MNPEKWTLESCGITKSPLDAYRGSGRHTKRSKPKPLFSDLTLIKPFTLNTESHPIDFPDKIVLKSYK